MAEIAREAVLSIMANIFDEDFRKRFGKYKSSRSQMFFKISVLKNFANFTGKHRLGAWIFIKNGAPAQMFPYKICEISNDTFFYRTALAAASGNGFGKT